MRDGGWDDSTRVLGGAVSARPRHARTGALATTVLLLALVASACTAANDAAPVTGPGGTEAPRVLNTKGPADGGTPVEGGQIVMGLEAEPEGLDPTRYAFAAAGHYIASAVFEPLATVDENGKAVPYLASSITPNSDFTTWTIAIPEGVTFHDGTKLDANVVLANLEAHRGSIITKLAMQTVTEMRVVDGSHVTVKLDKPWVRFPALLTSQIGYVLAPAMLTDPELSKKPIGTGPYVFEGHADGQFWKFKKNPSYRRKGLPHLESIEFRVLIDDIQRVDALAAGDVDMVHAVKPDPVIALKGSDVYKVVNYSSGEEDFISLNTLKPPFDNLTARKAVAYATDSQGWIKDRTKGTEQPSNSPYAPGQLGYEKDNGYPAFDLDKAKELVKQYETETGLPFEFTFVLVEGVDDQADAQYFLEQYLKAGMKVTLQTFKQIQLVAQTATGNYQMSLFRNFGFHDPDTDATFFRSASALDLGGVSLNFPHFRDPAVDEALDKALAASADADRDAAYRSLQRELAAKLPYIWLGRPEWVLAASPHVNGMYAAANGSIQTLGAKTWMTDLWVAP
jgi:ABC-type transport system substrate-binding protein